MGIIKTFTELFKKEQSYIEPAPMPFTLSDIWNLSVETEEWELRPRDYCWASELGRPLIDRYHAMLATKPTNPPNLRSKRKFFAGDVWEFVAGIVLHQMGIVKEGQERVTVSEFDLEVVGKLDFKIGGKPNYKKARKTISRLQFDRKMTSRFLRVIDMLEDSFGNTEIEEMVYEIKSCSEYVLEKVQDGGSIPGHDLQLFHYIMGLNMPYGYLCYISKNDSLMAEKKVSKFDQTLYEKYRDDLTALKSHLDLNEEPAKEPLITWEGNRFSKNFGIEYSQYLTMLYGFSRPDEYSEAVSPKISSWNRVITRLSDISEGKTTPTGKKIELTDKNKEAIEAMNKEGHDIFKLLNLKPIL